MNTPRHIGIFIITTLLLSGFTSGIQSSKPKYKHFGQIAYFFESKEDLKNFFDFNPHDTIAEIGAGDGLNILDLTLHTDSVTIYIQDIDSVALSPENFERIRQRCKRLKKYSGHHYERTIGTVKSSNLPNNAFDKIILVMTFHEFGYIEEMLSDIFQKLKPSGKLYILEARCFHEGHPYYESEELTALLERSKFKLLKMEGKDYYRSHDLYRSIFVKDTADIH